MAERARRAAERPLTAYRRRPRSEKDRDLLEAAALIEGNLEEASLELRHLLALDERLGRLLKRR
jgi:hypothetical protein